MPACGPTSILRPFLVAGKIGELSLLLALAVALARCTTAGPGPEEQGTARMVARLDSLAAQVDPETNPVANAERVARFRAVGLPPDPASQIALQQTLARELLYAGENEEAITLFKALLSRIENENVLVSADVVERMQHDLAVAYLRLGEQQNCLVNPTAEACILPIRPAGYHAIQDGSRGAIQAYTSILERHPNDLTARWLLNLAYMTLGEYPDHVPERWRIAPDVFASDYDIGHFRDVAPQTGLTATGLSGGSVTEDFNGDGLLDVMTSSWGLRDPLRYFENTGNGSFVERTDSAGLTGLTGGINLVQADYNNDGHPDVLVLRGAWLEANGRQPNSLLENNGDGTFADATEKAGLLSFHPTQTAAWADYDGDGWLDLFIGNESTAEAPHPCELYRNNGDGTFTDLAAELGLDVQEAVKGVAWGDYTNDGRPDLYLSLIAGPNRLYRNNGPDASGAWRFTDVTREAGVQYPLTSFATWFWDYDNDGWQDLLVLPYSVETFFSTSRSSTREVAADYLGLATTSARPRLYHNEGNGTFADVTIDVGLDRVLFAMGSGFGDLDNDGWLDFYVGTGAPDLRALMPNRMFRNDGGVRFQDVTTSGGFGHLQKGHAVAFADLDNDGDQDVYANMGGAYSGDVFQNALFKNPGHGNHWITLLLEGTTSNRSAIGARIKVTLQTADSLRTLHRTVSADGSFGAASLRQEVGLGEAERIASVEVTWPAMGAVQRFENVAMDQIYRLREGAAALEPLALPTFSLGGATGRPHHGSH